MENKYLVFTRKWRPKTFDEIVGQDQVIIPLKRAIEINRIMQAYLFSGPRGTGKTTTARIFAKALNCEKGPTVNPCNKCDICKEISEGSSLDVIEIDGASNRGIDEIRQLRESVGFGAAKGRYKIYIIDEVHMLTKEAFNALLKTLEEPPRHVIFIFATTDPQQIPQTILSRCQQFKFKKLPQNLIYENLKFIAKNENIEVDDNAIAIIAKSVDGALRDAQRIFDQAITYSKNEKVTEEIVRNLLGAIKIDMLKNVIEAIINEDMKLLIEIVEKIFEEGYDLKIFLKELIENFRNILLIKIGNSQMVEISNREEYEFLKKMEEKIEKEKVLFYLQKLTEIEQMISRTYIPNIALEVSILDMILKSKKGIEKKIEEKKEIDKKPIEEKKVVEVEPTEEKKFIVEEIEEDEIIENLTKDIIVKKWENIVTRAEALKEEEDFIISLKKCKIISFENNKLLLLAEDSFILNRLKKKLEVIKKILNDEFKRKIEVDIIEKNAYLKRVEVHKDVALEEAKNNPVVKKLEEIFGKFEEISIKK